MLCSLSLTLPPVLPWPPAPSRRWYGVLLPAISAGRRQSVSCPAMRCPSGYDPLSAALRKPLSFIQRKPQLSHLFSSSRNKPLLCFPVITVPPFRRDARQVCPTPPTEHQLMEHALSLSIYICMYTFIIAAFGFIPS